MPYSFTDDPTPYYERDVTAPLWFAPMAWHGMAAIARLLELQPCDELYEVLNNGGRLTPEHVATLADLFERDPIPLIFQRAREYMRKAHEEQIPIWVSYDEGITGIQMSHCLGHEKHPVFDCAGPFEAEWEAARGEKSAADDEHWQWPRLGGVGRTPTP